MARRFLLLFLVGSTIFQQCVHKVEHNEDFSFVDSHNMNLYDNSIVDNGRRIEIELPLTSLVEDLQITDDGSFLFVDKNLCHIYIFDSLGRLDYTFFNRGRGPSEIPTNEILGYVPMPNGGHVVIGENIFMLFDSLGVRKKQEVLNIHGAGNVVEGTPSDPSIYTMSYEKFRLREHNNKIYYNVCLEHPQYNFTKNVSDYYNNARSLFVTDINTNEVVAMLGKYPDIYKNGGHNQFSMVNFDVNNKGQIFLSFEASEYIYAYNENLKPEKYFGIKGEDMRVDYPALKTIPEFRDNYQAHRETYSYYAELEFMDEIDVLTRKYVKNSITSDGLQIYNKDFNLLADISIPKGYKIGGSHENKLYLYSLAETDDTSKMEVLIINL